MSEPLHIYHLRPRDPRDERFGGYDVFSGFVVAAASEQDARALIERCADECRDEGCMGSAAERTREHCVWRRDDVTACERIGVAVAGVEPGIIEESFHAG